MLALDGAVASAADAPADVAPAVAPDEGRLPDADVVVLGTVKVLVPPRGMGSVTVVRVEVEKALKGAPPPVFTLFVGGSRNTADASRPSAPYFENGKGGRYALFLRPTPNESGFALEALFAAEDGEGREKSDVLERELALGSVADEGDRTQRRVALMLDLLAVERPWTRLHAGRELAAIAQRAPAAIPDAARREIAAIARRTFDEVLRARLARVLAAVEDVPAADATGAEPSGAAAPTSVRGLSPEYHRALRRLQQATDVVTKVEALSEVARLGRAGAGPDLLRVAQSADDAAVVERAIVLLGDVGARSTLSAVLALDAPGRSPAVEVAVVRAVGLLGDGGDVPWLVERTRTPTLARAAAFALARVRDEAALAALTDLARQARRATPPDDALAALADYLRTPGFVETEKTAGRAVGPRAARERGSGAGGGPDGGAE